MESRSPSKCEEGGRASQHEEAPAAAAASAALRARRDGQWRARQGKGARTWRQCGHRTAEVPEAGVYSRPVVEPSAAPMRLLRWQRRRLLRGAAVICRSSTGRRAAAACQRWCRCWCGRMSSGLLLLLLKQGEGPVSLYRHGQRVPLAPRPPHRRRRRRGHGRGAGRGRGRRRRLYHRCPGRGGLLLHFRGDGSTGTSSSSSGSGGLCLRPRRRLLQRCPEPRSRAGTGAS